MKLMLGLLCMVSGFVLRAQSDTVHLYQVFHTFSNTEKAEWTSYENSWNFNEYPKLKEKAKIKDLSCKSCESFYADILIHINEKGEIDHAYFMNGKQCGKKLSVALEMDFEDSTARYKFQHLKNRQFIVRFGNVLKC